jgi:hypothetical protein
MSMVVIGVGGLAHAAPATLLSRVFVLARILCVFGCLRLPKSFFACFRHCAICCVVFCVCSQVLPVQCGGPERCSRDQGPPADVCGSYARQVPLARPRRPRMSCTTSFAKPFESSTCSKSIVYCHNFFLCCRLAAQIGIYCHNFFLVLQAGCTDRYEVAWCVKSPWCEHVRNRAQCSCQALVTQLAA